MHGDEELGTEEHAEMLRAQASDPRCDQGPDGRSPQSLLSS